jgi:hypothetical protein
MFLYDGAELSGVSLPVTRPTGRAIIVGQSACRAAPLAILQRMGFACTEAEDPYEAMVHLCRRPLFFSTVILSLNSLFREELAMIASLKLRYTHVEVWLTDTDGRQAALAEAMRQGADGLVAVDGFHRMGSAAPSAPPSIPASPVPPAPQPVPPGHEIRQAESSAVPEPLADPLLTAEELRALLAQSPGNPG